MTEFPVFGLSPDMVIRGYCRATRVSLEAITGPDKTRQISRARHELMYLLRLFTSCSHATIGTYLGNRDLATVQAGINGVCDRIATDAEYRGRVQQLGETVARASDESDPVQVIAARAVLADRALSDADARNAALSILGGRHGA